MFTPCVDRITKLIKSQGDAIKAKLGTDPTVSLPTRHPWDVVH
jgi:hypothetical protein